MSAWLCHDHHIHAIVQQLIAEKVITLHMADDVGRQLLYENKRSLYVRYPHLEDRPVYDDIDYSFRGIEAPLDLACVVVACRSWKYQTCEIEDADDMPGWKMVTELEEILCNDLGISNLDDPLAVIDDDAQSLGWAITDLTTIVQRSST